MARTDSTWPERPKPYEPNRILRWFYQRFFAHIVIDERWQHVVQTAADRGVVVYVMRSISFLDFLCADYLTKRFGLPLIRFVNDLGLWILEPFGKGLRRLRLRRQVPEDRALRTTAEGGFGALLFLRRPPSLLKTQPKRPNTEEIDLLRTLIETQRQTDKPILLVPQTFVWSKLPPNKRRSILDVVFGPSEWPGKIRVAFQFLLNYRNALLRAGEPFDLQAFCEQNRDLSDHQLADKVRYALLRIMERERSMVLGPRVKTPGRIRDELLRSPRVLKHIHSHARLAQKPIPKVLRQARRELKRLTAAPNPHVIAFLKTVLDRVWNRIYEGMEVDREGLERVRASARKGTLVLLPCHKSHVDYLVLSDVLYRNALSPPLIAAGDNLNFVPVGSILRRGGAFFIRRSFKGRRLYPALVDGYIRKLIAEGFNVEFFLEGGRSRTGKLLEPKFGLLSMVVDAALLLSRRRVYFVPVSISYERIVEERSYVHEAEGGEKKKESVSQLLKSTRLLRSRFGRLYVQFGEILPFDELKTELLTERGSSTSSTLKAPEKRALVQRIAYRVIDQINRVTIVTPSALVATALLCNRRRGMAHDDLIHVCAQLVQTLRAQGAGIAEVLVDDADELRHDTVSETVALFLDGKLLARHGEGANAVYTVPEERRLAVEYYKNNILHFFVPRALIASGIFSEPQAPTTDEELRRRVLYLSRLFKHDFMYRADAGFDEIFDENIRRMLDEGELVRDGNQIVASDNEAGRRVVLYSNMVRTYFESYRLAVRGVSLLRQGAMTKREWTKRTLSIGQRMYLSGEIELRESLSKHRLEAALHALKEQRVIRLQSGDMVSTADQADDGLAVLEAELAGATP